MENGHHICNELRALRRHIADENQIPLEMEECTYRGECCGTCPRCDAEVRYLEEALSHRITLGKAVTVQAQNVTDTASLKSVAKEISDTVGKVRVTGVVKNARTKDLEPFVNVVFKKNGEMVTETATDMDGSFELWLKPDRYEIVICCIGFAQYEFSIDITNVKELKIGDIFLEEKKEVHIIVGRIRTDPLIDKDPYGPTQTIKYDGVKVIAR